MFVMLPRVPAWYTVPLGAIRIGAVPMPGPNLLTSRDIAYRLQGGQAVAAVTSLEGAAKVDAIDVPPSTLQHRVCWTKGAPPAGWLSLDAILDDAADGVTPSDPTSCDDPMILYFTSGTVSHPARPAPQAARSADPSPRAPRRPLHAPRRRPPPPQPAPHPDIRQRPVMSPNPTERLREHAI